MFRIKPGSPFYDYRIGGLPTARESDEKKALSVERAKREQGERQIAAMRDFAVAVRELVEEQKRLRKQQQEVIDGEGKSEGRGMVVGDPMPSWGGGIPDGMGQEEVECRDYFGLSYWQSVTPGIYQAVTSEKVKAVHPDLNPGIDVELFYEYTKQQEVLKEIVEKSID